MLEEVVTPGVLQVGGVMGVVVPYVKDGLSCAVVNVTVGLVSLLYYIHIRI